MNARTDTFPWRKVAAAAMALGLTTGAATAGAATLPATPRGVANGPVVSFGPSDAVSIPLLAGTYYINPNMAGGLPGWWNHTNLTVAVQSAPTTSAADIQAVHDGIALWRSVLAARLPQVSLTDVTSGTGSPKSADIVIHLVPHAGGIVWGGDAICGSQKCLNILVKSNPPPGHLGEPDIFDHDPVRVERTTLHELGHALGLGHATPLEQSIDIMG